MRWKLQLYKWLITALAIPATVFAQAPQKGLVLDKIVAKVDNYVVLKSELELSYLQYLSGAPAKSESAICRVLETLLINKLLMAKSETDSVTVEDKAVDDQLDRRMQYFVAQVGSEKKLEEYYGKTVQELKSELREQVEEQLVTQKMQSEITKGISLTPGEVRRFFNQIPKDSLPFYSTEVEVAHLVRFPKVNRNMKHKTREMLLDFKAQIESGKATFEELAKKYSQDPASAISGGNLGFWNRGDMVPAYEEAALKLEPGKLSDPVESEFGFHLIRLDEKRGLKYNSSHILIRPVSSTPDIDETKIFLDSIRSLIIADSLSFEKAVKEHSEDKITLGSGGFLTDQETGDTRIAMDKIDPVIFFIIDTMPVGNISAPQPYRTADGKEGLRLIYYKSKTQPHRANLKDDYQKIYAAALEEKKNKLLHKWFLENKGDVYIDVDEEFDKCEIFKNL